MNSGGKIDLSHGGGGRAMERLVDEIFIAAFDNDWLRGKNDQAAFSLPPGKVVMSTDAFVVSPLFFPGGDIGHLAVNGTVNDVAMAGGRPIYLSAAFIIEEGFPISDLTQIAGSMASAARAAGVAIVTGDTKVVERGKGDGVFIATTGIGVVPEGVNISAGRAVPGDVILLSGTMGDHGIAVMSKRSELGLDVSIQSDTAPLHGLVAKMIEAAPDIHCMRDPTRGGLGSALNEIAKASGVGMLLREDAIPVRTEVRGACEILGYDPLYVANEGKLVAICAPDDADRVLRAMRSHPLGKDAARIGAVHADSERFVQVRTSVGGVRILSWLEGEQLPRIC